MGNHFYDLKLSFPYSKSFLFLWVSALFLMSMKYAIHFGKETAIKNKIVKLNKNILLILDQTKFLNPTLSFLHWKYAHIPFKEDENQLLIVALSVIIYSL